MRMDRHWRCAVGFVSWRWMPLDTMESRPILQFRDDDGKKLSAIEESLFRIIIVNKDSMITRTFEYLREESL
jgi:hypothetical protein